MPLVFVPTPLGNLRDITLRALDVLRDCDLLVAEDTRVARKLLSALNLPGKEIWSHHDHNVASSTAGILERARTQLVAVTTDAGMPGISDPGAELAAAARAAGIAVEALPGPSAALGAALLSGFELRRFAFEGFPPRASRARRAALLAAMATHVTSIWYESPQRVRATLRDLAEVAPDARVFLLREYTKLHEQQILGSPQQVNAALEEPVRGEIVLVLAGAPAGERALPDEDAIDAAIDALLAQGMPVSAVARALVERGFGARRDLYARATVRKRPAKGA
ncbi:MAG TPA: 16S rRNA (cytidine(1402)-2'-O)-methyltransferase [Candidatus Baltobacteraceae bacterium]